MEKIVGRIKGKLIQIIRDTGSKFDNHSISPKIRQILLHWGRGGGKGGYELTKKDFFF